MNSPDQQAFESFMKDLEPRLRKAFFAMFGRDRGWEATAESLAWAWEHWSRISTMENPAGMLFRVGQSRTRRRKRPPTHFARPDWDEPWVEPGLREGLLELSERQRLAVVLVHGFGWTLKDVAELTKTKIPTIQTHLERGLARLRVHLEVDEHA
jgi:RNA polymerase sigma-70 factor (ECF subfamily)